MSTKRKPSFWDWLFDPEKYGTDDQGRRIVNSHGDIDVVRTDGEMHAVQLPLEKGCLVRIDNEVLKFWGFRNDVLVFTEPGQEFPKHGRPSSSITEGVQRFNTRVRNAEIVRVVQDRSIE